MNALQTLHSFWANFGWKAYESASVPDDAELPYITHETSMSEFGQPISLTATLWHRSTSWNEITDKELEISGIIGRGGKVLAYDGGALWITKGAPWAIRLPAENDDSVRRVMLNYTVEYFE